MADAPEILQGLKDIRLPAASEGGALADTAAAFAVGLALALLVVLAARLFLKRPPSRRAAALDALARSRALAPGERLLAQARLLQRLAAEAPPDSEERGDERAAGEAESVPAWPSALDRRFGTDFFTAGPGAALREALYRPAPAGEPGVDPGAIDRELLRLLKRMRG